jgi:hypothetical protein
MTKKPKIIAIEDPNRLTIKAENLLKLVIIIGNSSFNKQNCNKKPIITLKINNIIKGNLKFNEPSWDLLKSVILL